MNQAVEAPVVVPVRQTVWRRWSRVAAGVVAALVLLVGGVYWWSVGRFLESTDDAYVRADWVAVSPQISGYIAEVAVAENQAVKAGDLLVRLDDRDYRERLRAREAEAAAARAALQVQDARLQALTDERLAQQQAIVQAQAAEQAGAADALRARQEGQRYAGLAREHATSAQRAEQAHAGQVGAEARLIAARASTRHEQVRLAILDSRRREATAERERLQAQSEQADAARALARNALADTELRAPFDGVIGQRKARVRQYVSPGLPLLALVPVQDAYVVANFKETQLQRMHPGQAVTLDVDSFGQRWSGHVDSFSPGSGAVFALLPPDNATGNFTKIVQRFPVRIRLDPHDRGQLLPGMSVVATVDTRSEEGGGEH
ncbi:MAG: Multidrug export protein EmrA [Stenotrophomonas maltophilia]|nr:MAG: Multidrug export protein EmrA [Stenotrophomonas maltophilia]